MAKKSGGCTSNKSTASLPDKKEKLLKGKKKKPPKLVRPPASTGTPRKRSDETE